MFPQQQLPNFRPNHVLVFLPLLAFAPLLIFLCFCLFLFFLFSSLASLNAKEKDPETSSTGLRRANTLSGRPLSISTDPRDLAPAPEGGEVKESRIKAFKSKFEQKPAEPTPPPARPKVTYKSSAGLLRTAAIPTKVDSPRPGQTAPLRSMSGSFDFAALTFDSSPEPEPAPQVENPVPPVEPVPKVTSTPKAEPTPKVERHEVKEEPKAHGEHGHPHHHHHAHYEHAHPHEHSHPHHENPQKDSAKSVAVDAPKIEIPQAVSLAPSPRVNESEPALPPRTTESLEPQVSSPSPGSPMVPKTKEIKVSVSVSETNQTPTSRSDPFPLSPRPTHDATAQDERSSSPSLPSCT